MEPLIKVQGLKKHFDTPHGKLHAVDGVDFIIEPGKTLGVVGESGCGKSTLGRVLLQLMKATDGSVFYNGKDVVELKNKELKEVRRDLQIIFQDPYASLNPRKSVGEIIEEPIIVNGLIKDKKAIEKRVYELMELVGLADRLINAYPHELDGGRRQRIGIARALALNPKFIVCDEPVSALDVSIQAQILNLLMDLQEELGISYMFITHDLSVVRHISDEIMVMYLGQCVERGSSKAIFNNPLHPYTKALLSAIPVADLQARDNKRILLKGEVTSPINPEPGCRFKLRCIHSTEKCKNVRSLVEVESGHWVLCSQYNQE